MTGFNSTRCPVSAAIVKAYREAFGEDVRVQWLDETGVTYGRDERENNGLRDISAKQGD